MEENQSQFDFFQQAMQAGCDLFVRMAESTEKAARAAFDLSRQAVRGEPIQPEGCLDRLEDIYGELCRSREALPFAKLAPAPLPDDWDFPFYQEAKQYQKALFGFNARLIQEGMKTVRAGAAYFIRPEAFDAAVAAIDRQRVENWEQGSQVLGDWLDWVRENSRFIAEESRAGTPFARIYPDFTGARETSARQAEPEVLEAVEEKTPEAGEIAEAS